MSPKKQAMQVVYVLICTEPSNSESEKNTSERKDWDVVTHMFTTFSLFTVYARCPVGEATRKIGVA